MKLPGHSCFALIALTFFSYSNAAFSQETKVDWVKDLNAIVEQLPEKHVDFFDQLDKSDFRKMADEVRRKFESGIGDAEASIELMRLINLCKDGHTTLVPNFTYFRYYPINVRWFDDGLFIVNADIKLRNWIGWEIVKVGDKNVPEIAKACKPFMAHDNEFGFRNRFERDFNTADYLKFSGGAKNNRSVELTLKKDGKTETIELTSFPQSELASSIRWSYRPKTVALYQKKGNLDFWNDWIADKQTVYFKYNRCRDANGFSRLVAGTRGFIEGQDVEKFVVDLRDNGGGNSSVFRPLLQYLKDSDLNRKGKLFVIVGRKTYSSGMWNAIELKTQTNATIIGEPTGGRPNHFGEIRPLVLPSSKLKVYYSTRRWNLMKGSKADSLEPDLRIKFNSSDFFQGKDPWLDAVFDPPKK